MLGIQKSCAAFLLFALCVMTQAAETNNAVTDFFKSHPDAIDLKEEGGSLLFANRQIGLEFHKSATSLHLVRLYGIAANQDFLAAPTTQPQALFEVRMDVDPRLTDRNDVGKIQGSLMGIVDEMGKDAFTVSATDSKSVSWRREGGDADSTLHLDFKDLDARESKAALNVEVTVTLRADDPFSYWRIKVRNDSTRYGIERARFPIAKFAPIGKAEEDVLVYPRSRGRMVQGPFKKQTIQGFYTCDFEMQFQALYDKQSGNGIYLATQQSVPWLSHFQIECSPTEISWTPSHFPPNIRFAPEAAGDNSQNLDVPYDCVIGPFKGDWFDACQIYRKWAIKQSWCSKGPLSTRKDVPKWYKESPLYFYSMINDSGEGTHSMDENLRIAADEFRTWLKWAGMKLPINLYAWEQPTPGLSMRDMPFQRSRSQLMNTSGRWSGMMGHNSYDGNYPVVHALKDFSAQCADLRNEGGMVCPYVAMELFNPGPAENAPFVTEAKPNAIRDLFGCIRTWGGDGAWQMCSASTWWQQRLKDECLQLQEREHVGGLYLDVMRGSCLPCYWIAHGHSAAGGDSMTTSRHELARIIFDSTKAKDPEAIITGENPCENMIDVIDGMLVYTLWPDNQAPLLATVYQDYVKRYGLELSTGPGYHNRFASTFDENAFFIESASLFVEGAQIGRIRLKPRDASLSLSNPDQKEMIDFLSRMVGYYKHDATKNYLAYGQLMRPLVFSAPSPMPMLSYKSGGEYSALMSGVFRIDDGSLGVVVVNASRNETSFQAELDPAQYEFASGTVLSVESIASNGSTQRIAQRTDGKVKLNGSLEPHGVTMFRLKPVAAAP